MNSLLNSIEDSLEFGDNYTRLEKIFKLIYEDARRSADIELKLPLMYKFYNKDQYLRVSETVIDAVLDHIKYWYTGGATINNLFKVGLTVDDIWSIYKKYFVEKYGEYTYCAWGPENDVFRYKLMVNLENAIKYLSKDENFVNYIEELVYFNKISENDRYHYMNHLLSYNILFTEKFKKMSTEYIKKRLKEYIFEELSKNE